MQGLASIALSVLALRAGGQTCVQLQLSSFFFQAEDGIRYLIVIGVQTCFFFFSSRRRHTRSDRDWSSDVCSSDLPAVKIILAGAGAFGAKHLDAIKIIGCVQVVSLVGGNLESTRAVAQKYGIERSEERRVGKECRSRWSPYH